MRLTCQSCGAAISLDAAIGHEGASEAVQIALRLPAPIGKLLVQYVGLFRPAKRQLSMDRLASLLGELLAMIDAARVERNGRSYIAPIDYWRIALEDMLTRRDKLTLPLKSHGYLMEIIAGLSDKAEARKEVKDEQDRKHAAVIRSESTSGAVTVKRQGMPKHISETLAQFRSKTGGNDDGDQA